MTPLWLTLKTLPKLQLALLVGVVLLVVAMISGGVSRITSYFERRAFTKEIEGLKIERDKFKATADAAEARAIAAESDKIKFELALEIAEKQEPKAQKKIADAKEAYDKAIVNIDSDMPICERLNIARASLGLKPVACTEENNPGR